MDLKQPFWVVFMHKMNNSLTGGLDTELNDILLKYPKGKGISRWISPDWVWIDKTDAKMKCNEKI